MQPIGRPNYVGKLRLSAFFIVFLGMLGMGKGLACAEDVVLEFFKDGSTRGWASMVSIEDQPKPWELCTLQKKTFCHSSRLLEEQIEPEIVATESASYQPNVKGTSSPELEQTLLVNIYVDQRHRNFQEDIVEIFEQSLLYQKQHSQVSISVKCLCDDRETNAYGFVLGKRWGERTKDYLQALAFHPSHIEVINYGLEKPTCSTTPRLCHEEEERRKAAFRFLAINESQSGCLLQLNLNGITQNALSLSKSHPLFLQKIHVAGVIPSFHHQ